MLHVIMLKQATLHANMTIIEPLIASSSDYTVRYLSGPETIPKNPETFQNWLGVINGFNPSQKYACHFNQSSHAWLKKQ